MKKLLILPLLILALGACRIVAHDEVKKEPIVMPEVEPIPDPTPTPLSTPEPIPIPTPTPEPEVKLVSLGEFKLTAYCGCDKCCGKWAKNRPTDEDGKTIVCGAIGKRLISNYSIAVDPKVIPYGTVVIIDGHEYEAMDCGGGIKGNRIDVYFESHDEAKKFAIGKSEIFIKELD